MTTFHLLSEHTPFDILVKNFFQDSATFAPIADSKIPHPVDIYETSTHLIFEVACTGIPKEELEIQTQGNILRINYNKQEKSDKSDKQYLYKGIARRSFNLGWKIDSKFDLSKIQADFTDGLLSVKVPFAKGSELKTIKL